MKKSLPKTDHTTALGVLETDGIDVRFQLKIIGWTAKDLAERSKLSYQTISSFVTGRRRLSPEASDRVFAALNAGWQEKKAGSKPRLSPEAAARIRQRADKVLSGTGPGPESALGQYARLVALSQAPQCEPESHKLRAERARNAELEKELIALREADSIQKQLIANSEEIVSLYSGWVDRLKKQLLGAGLTPTD